MRLNVGCGSKVLAGYENIDLYVKAPSVVNYDIRKLPHADGSVDEVLAEDILEHFPRLEWKSVLAEWIRVLKAGGVLTIQAPEMPDLAQALIAAPDMESWESYNRRIFGGQGDGRGDGQGMYHYTGFSWWYLRRYCESIGLKYVNHFTKDLNFKLTMMKPTPSTRPEKTTVILSATPESDYSFLLPFTMLLWREVVGFEPVAYLVGNWTGHRGSLAAMQALAEHSFRFYLVAPLEGYSPLATGKHIRQHAACNGDVDDDTWLMPADADLWPLKHGFYHQHENAIEKAVLYYSNGDGFRSKQETLEKFADGRRFQTIPMCHTTMRAREWRSTWQLRTDEDIARNLRETFHYASVGDASKVPSGESQTGWDWWVNSDQRVLTWMLAQQPWFHDEGHGDAVRYLRREGGPPKDRLDRAFPSVWMKADLSLYTDAHCPKTPERHDNWQMLRRVFVEKLPHQAEWADHFYNKYTGLK